MNEVTIVVKAINGTKATFTEIKKESLEAGDIIATNITDASAKRLTQDAQTGQSGFARSADTIGTVMGDRISDRINQRVRERVTQDANGRLRDERGRFVSSSSSSSSNTTDHDRNREHVTVDVDVDKQSLLGRISNIGKDISGKFSSFFKDGLGSGLAAVFSGDLFSTIVKGGLVTAAVANLAPAIGAALTAGILVSLGGGFIGAGLIAAFQTPQVKEAFTGLKKQAKDTFADFGVNFIGPILHFADGLKNVFKQIEPMVDHLGQVFAPVADNLGKGVIAFLQNALPGILRAVEASAPLIQVLADNLPGLGTEIGKFFDHIKNGAPEAAVFFDDLLHAIRLVIRILGNFIELLTNMYMVARNVVVGMVTLFLWLANTILTAADKAFGWIPGFKGKIAPARQAVADFTNDVNHYLSRIPSTKTIPVRFRIVGQAAANAAVRVANILANKATGGIVGAASGGIRSGLTMVGENGPELLDAAPGSHVYSNSDSRRLAAGTGGGGQPFIVQLILDGQTIAQATVDPMRRFVQNNFGGSVQSAYGMGG